MTLSDKIALVTGAAAGIGLGIVSEFLKAGIKGVFMTDINSSEGAKQLQNLRKEFGTQRVAFHELDVTNSNKYEEAIKKALALFGRLDIVVNNAGIPNESDVQRMIDVNFTAVITGTNLGLKYLGKDQNGNGGIIINLASIASLEVTYPVPIYTATKTGVAGLTRAWGHHFHYERTGVRVIGICPGKTMTNFFKSEQLMSNEEWKRHTDSQEFQNPDVVGRAAVFIIKSGESGTLWVVERSKLFKTNIPDRETYSEFVIDLI